MHLHLLRFLSILNGVENEHVPISLFLHCCQGTVLRNKDRLMQEDCGFDFHFTIHHSHFSVLPSLHTSSESVCETFQLSTEHN